MVLPVDEAELLRGGARLGEIGAAGAPGIGVGGGGERGGIRRILHRALEIIPWPDLGDRRGRACYWDDHQRHQRADRAALIAETGKADRAETICKPVQHVPTPTEQRPLPVCRSCRVAQAACFRSGLARGSDPGGLTVKIRL